MAKAHSQIGMRFLGEPRSTVATTKAAGIGIHQTAVESFVLTIKRAARTMGTMTPSAT